MLHKNYTRKFINLIKQVSLDNSEYFIALDSMMNNKPRLLAKVLMDLNIPCDENSMEYPRKAQLIIKDYIKNYISQYNDKSQMDVDNLKKIADQVEIEYLEDKREKEEALFYCSISGIIFAHRLCEKETITSFDNSTFWEYLIKLLIILHKITPYIDYLRCDKSLKGNPEFNKIYLFVENKQFLEKSLNEKINTIDGKISFKKNQEEKIIKKIEKKLAQLNLFNLIDIVLKNKKAPIAHKYIINILIKNIVNSKHKNDDVKKAKLIIKLLDSFISLYQLSNDSFEAMHMSEKDIVSLLRKQVLFSNFYSIYELKTETLTKYIENIVIPSIDEDRFFEAFGFTIADLISVIELFGGRTNNIISYEESDLCESHKKIFKLFSIASNQININYALVNSLDKVRNPFVMNPILKHKHKFYIIGFKYFKMNFYNTLVEKIRKNIDPDINNKIGKNIDLFVEKMFSEIQHKGNYEIFSGNYTPPKKENPESDLLLKFQEKIILLENKNKYLTNSAFSGIDGEILKDFILSFVVSQKQLLMHEKNLKKFKALTFKNNKKVIYNNEKILKLSVSTNNWFGIMNNIPQRMLLSIINLNFNVDDKSENKFDIPFIQANKVLGQTAKVLGELYELYKPVKENDYSWEAALLQSIFVPLELIVEKYQDDTFIEILSSLASIKMNTDNILNIYDYRQYLQNHKSMSNPLNK